MLEFAALITDRSGVRRGVLTLSMVREPGGFLFLRTIALMIGVGSVVVGVLWLLLYKTLEGRILRPILKLSQGIQEVRAGNLGVHVEQTRRDEVGMVVESFNELIGILVERDSLQKRLEEARRLEEAHMRLNEAHRQLKSAQEQLILNEKHASLGRLVHGLNHELNNPLSAAKNMIPPLHNAVKALREGLVSRLSALDGSVLDSKPARP